MLTKLARGLDGLRIAKILEPIVSQFGAHIGLTGGCLYKDDLRKDIDFVVYKHNDEHTVGEPIRRNEIEAAMLGRGFIFTFNGPRVSKCVYDNFSIDLLYAEQFGAYTETPTEQPQGAEDEIVF